MWGPSFSLVCQNYVTLFFKRNMSFGYPFSCRAKVTDPELGSSQLCQKPWKIWPPTILWKWVPKIFPLKMSVFPELLDWLIPLIVDDLTKWYYTKKGGIWLALYASISGLISTGKIIRYIWHFDISALSIFFTPNPLKISKTPAKTSLVM